MKKILYLLIALSVVFLSSCSMYDSLHEPITSSAPYTYLTSSSYEIPIVEASFDYLTFEEALLEFATDIVVAQYIGSRPFGSNLTEFEFVVLERVLGNAADRIFVYAEGINAEVIGGEREVSYRPGDLTFNYGTDYLLALIGIGLPHANTHDDGFRFIRNIVIDLNNPINSTMYSEPLFYHSTELDFRSRSLTRGQIVPLVDELTRHNPPAREFIKSELLEDIITGSPYVLLVEISDLLRLSSEQISTDWMATDLYYTRVLQTLKGNINVGYEFIMIFLADTVQLGEQHIIAIEPLAEGINWYMFTSRNSLFRVEQLEEIMLIVD